MAVGHGVKILALVIALFCGAMATFAGPLVSIAALGLVLATPILWRLDAWQVVAVALLGSLIAAQSQWASEPSMAWRGIAVGALAGYTVILGRRQRASVRFRPSLELRFILMLGGFAAIAAASTVWSVDTSRTLTQAGALALLVTVVLGSMVDRWRNPSVINRDIIVLYGIIGLAVIASLVVLVAEVGEPFGGPRDRLRGVMANPNTLAMMCALLLPMIAGLARDRSQRVLLIVGASPVLVAVLLTESRTGIVAAAIGVVAALARGRMRGKAMLSVVVGMVVLMMFLPLLAPDRMPEPIERVIERFDEGGSQTYLSSREVAWSEALGLWQQSPIIGHGFRTGEMLFRDQRSIGELAAFGQANTAHSGYLQVLMESGFVGIVLVLGLLAVTLWPYRLAVSPGMAGLYGAVAAGWAMQVTESHLFGLGATFSTLFWLSAGMLMSLISKAAKHGRHDDSMEADTDKATAQT